MMVPRENSPDRPASVLLMGGSFDPVHTGHLVLARDAREYFGFEQVWLIPAGRSPHKVGRKQAEGEQRWAMLTAAIADEPGFRAWDGELRREGPSWTIDTVRAIRERLPDARLGWLIGEDNLPGLHTWKDAEALIRLVDIHVLRRAGEAAGDRSPEALKLPPDWCRTLPERTLEVRRIDVSSTDIRARLQKGLSIKYLVPDAVADYIASHHVY